MPDFEQIARELAVRVARSHYGLGEEFDYDSIKSVRYHEGGAFLRTVEGHAEQALRTMHETGRDEGLEEAAIQASIHNGTHAGWPGPGCHDAGPRTPRQVAKAIRALKSRSEKKPKEA